MKVNICSVVVREDKKLLTVLFPDGRDGRAFTLKVLICLDVVLLSSLRSDLSYLYLNSSSSLITRYAT